MAPATSAEASSASLLSQAGCSVTFVDVNASLVALLQEKQQYTVKLASEQAESFTVSGVDAINGNDMGLLPQRLPRQISSRQPSACQS